MIIIELKWLLEFELAYYGTLTTTPPSNYQKIVG